MLLKPLGFMRASGAIAPLFDVDFQAGATLPGTGVFSRASGGMALDHENIYRDVLSGELRHRGLRRVENLFTASGTPATQTITVVVDARYAFYFRDGGGTGSYALTGAATATVTEGANEAFTFTATTTSLVCTLSGSAGAGSSVQLEETSGSAVNAPGDYVDIDTAYNGEANGVKYFTTDNGYTFTAPGPGAVTEAAGSSIAAATREGALLEPAATNSCPDSHDLTTWTTALGGSATLDAVGIDGRDNNATTCTDPGSSGSRLFKSSNLGATGLAVLSFWIKKDSDTSRFPELQFVGYGLAGGFNAVQMNTSTGATSIRTGPTTFVSTVQIGDFWLLRIGVDAISTTGSIYIYPAGGTTLGVFNPAATGSIIVGHVQLEEGEAGTSPIRTSGATATRVADVLTMPLARAAPWTMFQDCKPQTTEDIALHALMGYVSGSNKAQIVRATTSYDGELDDGTDNPTANITDAAASYTMGDQLKVALSSVDGDQARMGLNGQSDEDLTGGVVNTSGYATAGIGMIQTGGADIPITVRQAQLLSVAKTTGELATMTTI